MIAMNRQRYEPTPPRLVIHYYKTPAELSAAMDEALMYAVAKSMQPISDLYPIDLPPPDLSQDPHHGGFHAAITEHDMREELTSRERKRMLWELHRADELDDDPSNGPRMLTLALMYGAVLWTIGYFGWHVLLWWLGMTPPQ